MKRNMVLACITAAIIVIAIGCTDRDLVHRPSGGYSAALVTNSEVIAAADFAVKATETAMRKNKDAQSTKLTFVKILSVQEQVVAGMNFRFNLKVNLNGTEKEAEAIVWWQAWRKPDPYRLTSWNWK
ncbi:MAG: hypothetical protein GY941_25190 [Planctomycetes bacterium]|nr:hypothetical protein [Planctomycetota bacterium]